MEPTTWPCGTPRSQSNAFTSWKQAGESAGATPRERAAAAQALRMAKTSSRNHEGVYSRAGTDGGMAKAKKKARA